jgi:hypothetical protein
MNAEVQQAKADLQRAIDEARINPGFCTEDELREALEALALFDAAEALEPVFAPEKPRGTCECGQRISENKTQCLSCRDKRVAA